MSSSAPDALEAAILRAVHETGSIPDTGPWAEGRSDASADVVGTLKSLEAADMIKTEVSQSECVR
jgi:hypothetical protein